MDLKKQQQQQEYFCVNVAPEVPCSWILSHSTKGKSREGVYKRRAYIPQTAVEPCSGKWMKVNTACGGKKYAEISFSKKWCLTKFGWPPGLSHSHKAPESAGHSLPLQRVNHDTVPRSVSLPPMLLHSFLFLPPLSLHVLITLLPCLS